MANGDFDFTAGQILTAAQVDDYLMLQAVMKFATSAARDSALTSRKREGSTSIQDDSNAITVYSGSAWSTIGPVHGAWTAYTPTWSGTLGNGTIAGAYRRLGRDIKFRVQVIWGTTTSHAAANQTLTVPVTMGTAAAFGGGLQGIAGVNIGGTDFYGLPWPTSTTVIKILASSSGSWTNTSPGTFANGHVMTVSGTYEASADA